jgi:hypothetical protein
MSVQFPLTWPDKVDTPERLAMVATYGPENFATAQEYNDVRDAMNQLYLIFQVAQGRRISKTVTGTAYTIDQSDFDKQLLFTSNTAVTVTVPQDIDFNTFAWQLGNGQLTITGASGVQISQPIDSYAKSELKGAVVGIIKIDSNKFNLIGKLQLI